MKRIGSYILIILLFVIPVLIGISFLTYNTIKNDIDTYDYNEKIKINDVKYRVMTKEEENNLIQKYDYNYGKREGKNILGTLPYGINKSQCKVLIPIEVPADLTVLKIDNYKKEKYIYFYMPSNMFDNIPIEEIYINEYTVFSENFMNNSGIKKIVATDYFEVKNNSFNNCELEEITINFEYFSKNLIPNFTTTLEYNTFSNLKNLKEIDVTLLSNGVFNNCNFTKFTYNGIPIVEVDTDYIYHTRTYESDIYKEVSEKYGYSYSRYYKQNNMVFCFDDPYRNEKISSRALFVNDAANNKNIKLLEGQEIGNTFILGNDFTFDLTKNDIYEIDEHGNLVQTILFKDDDNIEKELTFLVKALKNKYDNFDTSVYDAIISFAFKEVDLSNLTINTGTIMSYVVFYNCNFTNLEVVTGACEYKSASLGIIDLIQNDEISYSYGQRNPFFTNKNILIVSVI